MKPWDDPRIQCGTIGPGIQQCPAWVKDGCGRQADGTASVPSAPGIAGAHRHSRFVPNKGHRACLWSKRSRPMRLPI